MDLMESFRTLGRHWIMTSVLLVLTFAGTAYAFVKLPWTYQAQAQTVLLNSKSASEATGGNPYLAFDPSLVETADIISIEATDPRVAQVLAARGYKASYTVLVSSVTGGPVLLITATGHNKVVVENTVRAVTKEVVDQLVALQANVLPKNQIKMQLISLAPRPTHSFSKKAKPLVVVLALGLVLTFSIPQLVDGQIARRRARRGVTVGQDLLDHADRGPPSARLWTERVPSRRIRD